MNASQLPAIRLEGEHIKMLLVGIFIVGGILGYAIIAAVSNILRVRASEQTKREVAAYVAEGTMTPETAQMILGADAKKPWEQQVAQLISEGTIDTKEAEKLLRAGPKSGVAVEDLGAHRQTVST
ncbi:MAG: hypothetical protein K2W85_00600 [Phycisphaerales bacterium]|nr:hypothetical protein [Phycisphaerales bacterium]